MQWQDNIVKWTGLDINKAMRAAENREGWTTIVTKSTAPLRHPNAMRKCYAKPILVEHYN